MIATDTLDALTAEVAVKRGRGPSARLFSWPALLPNAAKTTCRCAPPRCGKPPTI